MKLRLLFIFSLFSFIGQAQYEDLVFEDYVYLTNIKSANLYPNADPFGLPVIYLNSTQSLVLTFDDLDNDIKDYSYTIIHCNKDWTPSDLDPIDYIEGFENEEIDNVNSSQNTFVPYTHYLLRMPSIDMRCIISGNYLLVVYEGNSEDDRLPAITKRFMVVDQNVSVISNFRKPLDVSKIRTNHEFDLFVNNKDFPISDPLNSVSVTVIQNQRWQTAISSIQPKFTVGDKMTIDNTGKFSFPAIKEHRNADLRSLDYIAQGINTINLTDNGTDVLLDLGSPTLGDHYIFLPDANGRFLIQNKDGGNNNTQGDYANVIFSLQSSLIDKEVYVMGSFTDYKPDEMYRMQYDEERGIYLANILLKQGYYDFYYGVDDGGTLDPIPIEGSSSQAENDYHVMVYLREPGDRYDRLIGYYKLNSNSF